MFELYFTTTAQQVLERLERQPQHAGLVKQIKKSLGFLQQSPRHPSLRTHPYHSIPNPYHPKEKVFEAYAQHKTPSAYRIFWCYGPEQGQVTIVAITPHP